MDTATLVSEQIDQGQTLIRELRASGFDVTAACWVLTSEDGIWFLYIASPIVDTAGLATAYREVYDELSKMPSSWIADSDIKLIGQRNAIAVDVIKYRSDKLPTRFGGRKLGSLIIDDAYIYPAG